MLQCNECPYLSHVHPLALQGNIILHRRNQMVFNVIKSSKLNLCSNYDILYILPSQGILALQQNLHLGESLYTMGQFII